MTQDPYCYPGSDVLRNLLDIRDAEQLAAAEAQAVAIRGAELRARPVPGRFDLDHLRAIHRRLFGDIYAWAGSIRTVIMSKSGYPFASPLYIEHEANQLFSDLRADAYLVGLPRDGFVDRAAHYLGEVNALHPFREGNGRTQREFFRLLAAEAGWVLDWTQVDERENIAAARHSLTTGPGLLIELLNRIARPA